MTDRPIIFSAAMIRALLEGRKTQTRRVLKPQPCVVGLQVTCPPNFHFHAKTEEGRDAYLNPFARFATGDRLWVREAFFDAGDHGLHYRADWQDREARLSMAKWQSPIFMPRALSRLTLTVTDVRVQRLQDISEDDAAAEGCKSYGWFCALWENLHGPEAWDANPWVAAISFTVRQGNIDA